MFGYLVAVTVLPLVASLQCRVCADGKVQFNLDMLQNITFPKDQYLPPCNPTKKDYTFVEASCNSSCVGFDYISTTKNRALQGSARLCGDGLLSDVTTLSGNRDLPSRYFKKYQITMSIWHCDVKDLCNDNIETIFASKKKCPTCESGFVNENGTSMNTTDVTCPSAYVSASVQNHMYLSIIIGIATIVSMI